LAEQRVPHHLLLLLLRGQLGGHGVGAELDHPGQSGVRQEGPHRGVELGLGLVRELVLASGQAADELAVVQQVAALLGEQVCAGWGAVAGVERAGVCEVGAEDVQGGQGLASRVLAWWQSSS
jgi:hypothetical protein